jgi:hypothetical protein
MPIVTISIALRAKSPAKQGSRQKTLTQKHSSGMLLRASEGDYNKAGNEIIAEAVFEALAGPCSMPASRAAAQNG